MVVIPALNPGDELVRLIAEIEALFSPRIIVINDGSDKKYTRIFQSIIAMGYDVLEHASNLGKGAALKSGFKHTLALYPDAGGIITADADGQHSPADIFRIAQRLDEDEDGIILGVRDMDGGRTPFKSKWGNKITSLVFWLKTGIRLRDTQTGLRAIPMRYVPDILLIKGTRYEYEMNTLLYAGRANIAILTMPIETIYHARNNTSHFRAVQDSARIYLDIVKFGCSSGLCAAADFGLFVFLSGAVFGRDAIGIAVSAILARVVSGICNFLLNKFIVFNGKGRAASIKYLLLFCAQMLLSAQFTALLAKNTLPAPIAKIIVDAILFVFSFSIQRIFIFKKEGKKDKFAE